MNHVRLAAAALAALSFAAAAQTQPPYTAVKEVRETLHGAEVVDNYRYFEEPSNPETQAFFRTQANYARSQLDSISGREALLKRIRSLSEFQTAVANVSLEGTRVFYLTLSPGLLAPVLCVREGFTGAERVLVDPQRFTQGSLRGAIDWFVASPDGSRVAYGVSRGGSEDSTLRVLDVATGRDHALEIDRARFNSRLAWHPDSRSFYYARMPESADSLKRYAFIRVYRHVLGRESAKDEVVFAAGVGGARDVPDVVNPRSSCPVAGHVRLDGIDARDADPRELRSRIAIVSQDPVIFAASVKENVRYGRAGATDGEVREALRASYALEFVERLPEGLDAQLGERGVKLSGGQRQRIAIARAILADRSVLLLDEATSSLDAESEKSVQLALERLMRNRTTLIIAHRLATVQSADRIVVMDHGRVVATGTHASLVAGSGLYARLAALQFNSVLT